MVPRGDTISGRTTPIRKDGDHVPSRDSVCLCMGCRDTTVMAGQRVLAEGRSRVGACGPSSGQLSLGTPFFLVNGHPLHGLEFALGFGPV